MKNFKKLVGSKIGKRRLELGYTTQRQLAEKLKVDTSRVNRWEMGENLPEGGYKSALLKVLKTDESLMDIIESVEKTDFTFVASFLGAFSSLSVYRKNFLLAVAFRDEAYISGEPALVQAYRTLFPTHDK